MNFLVAAAQQQLQNDNNVSADQLQTVEQAISKKHVLKTRKSYDTTIKHLAHWLHEKFPGCVTQNMNEKEIKINLPLPDNVILAYLASVQRGDEGNLIAVSTMGLKTSAINDLYKRERTLSNFITRNLCISQKMDGNSWKLFNGNKLENCFSNWLHMCLESRYI
jgi:hypothetical protein